MKKSIVDIIFEAELEEEVLELEPITDEDFLVESDIEIIARKDMDEYEGPYEVTPSSEVQTLNTFDLLCTNNITINAVPSNYGLITWNGTILTVS